jgi:hypothetical protein
MMRSPIGGYPLLIAVDVLVEHLQGKRGCRRVLCLSSLVFQPSYRATEDRNSVFKRGVLVVTNRVLEAPRPKALLEPAHTTQRSAFDPLDV